MLRPRLATAWASAIPVIKNNRVKSKRCKSDYGPPDSMSTKENSHSREGLDYPSASTGSVLVLSLIAAMSSMPVRHMIGTGARGVEHLL